MNGKLGGPVGEGRTADVFQYTDSAVVKLLKPGFPEWILDHEEKIYSAVQNLGLPIPRLLDRIKKDGRVGLVYEKINGITMIEAIQTHPFYISKYAADMACLHNDIGSCKAEGLPTYKERLLSGIGRQTILTEDEAGRAKDSLSGLSSCDSLCHCDFHPGNIMVDGQRYWVIDWVNASSGSFAADIMRTLMILSYAADPNGKLSAFVTRTAGFLLKKNYIKRLLALSGISTGEIYSWELPVIAARFSEDVPQTEETALKSRLEKLLN